MSSTVCEVSVIIKTLNEEKNIARAIESVLSDLHEVGGEVIVADSASSDRTVEIASNYPVAIVQLANPDERRCGIGPQLGYQHARGRFIYILDGDMSLRPGFLKEALAFLRQNPHAGGVAGILVERNLESLEFKSRVERESGHMKAGQVDRLDGGGFYRREAIEQAGYFSDRNLHSYEELDLAVRLRTAGWTLHRIDVPAVDHFGHQIPGHKLLMKRWRSRYINGIGEVLAAARGQAHAPLLHSALREAKLYTAFGLWLSLGSVIALFQPSILRGCIVLVAFIVFPWLLMALRKRSIPGGSYALLSMLFHVGGLIRGVMASRHPPKAPIAVREIQPSVIVAAPLPSAEI